MASETKTGTSRKSGSPAPKVVKKAASKTAAAGKTAKTSEKKKTAAPAKTDKPAARRATTPRKTKATGQPITAEARVRHIEVAAYYIAEKSGFCLSPTDCWIEAEREVDGLLLAGRL